MHPKAKIFIVWAHCVYMPDGKSSFGIRLRRDLIEQLDQIVGKLDYLKTTRSELVETLVDVFFATDFEHLKKAEEFIITKRKRDKR